MIAHKISSKLSRIMRQVWEEIGHDCLMLLAGEGKRDWLYRKEVIELVLDAGRVHSKILNEYENEEQSTLLAELRAILAQPDEAIIRSMTPVFPSGRYCS